MMKKRKSLKEEHQRKNNVTKYRLDKNSKNIIKAIEFAGANGKAKLKLGDETFYVVNELWDGQDYNAKEIKEKIIETEHQ